MLSRDGRREVKEIQDGITALRERFARISPPAPPLVEKNAATQSQDVPVSRDPAKVVAPKVKLKPITIPTFGGSMLEYPLFKSTFNALTSDQGHKKEVL